jgi:hypothetical protein
MAPPPHLASVSTVTGSRGGDVLIVVVCLAVMFALAPRLRVYFQVTMVEVTVERVTPLGARTVVPTPDEFMKLGAGYWRGDTLVAQLKPKVDAYMNASGLAHTEPPGTRYEWVVRWSDDSLRMDQLDRVIWEAPAR